MIVIEDEWSKKTPTMIIDELSQNIKLVSNENEKECIDMNIK